MTYDSRTKLRIIKDMRYLKTHSQLQREKAVEELKSHLLFVAGILVFLIILGLVGAVAR